MADHRPRSKRDQLAECMTKCLIKSLAPEFKKLSEQNVNITISLEEMRAQMSILTTIVNPRLGRREKSFGSEFARFSKNIDNLNVQLEEMKAGPRVALTNVNLRLEKIEKSLAPEFTRLSEKIDEFGVGLEEIRAMITILEAGIHQQPKRSEKTPVEEQTSVDKILQDFQGEIRILFAQKLEERVAGLARDVFASKDFQEGVARLVAQSLTPSGEDTKKRTSPNEKVVEPEYSDEYVKLMSELPGCSS